MFIFQEKKIFLDRNSFGSENNSLFDRNSTRLLCCLGRKVGYDSKMMHCFPENKSSIFFQIILLSHLSISVRIYSCVKRETKAKNWWKIFQFAQNLASQRKILILFLLLLWKICFFIPLDSWVKALLTSSNINPTKKWNHFVLTLFIQYIECIAWLNAESSFKDRIIY